MFAKVLRNRVIFRNILKHFKLSGSHFSKVGDFACFPLYYLFMIIKHFYINFDGKAIQRILLSNIFSATRSVAYGRLARDQAFRLRSNLLVFTRKSQHVFTKNMLPRDQMSVNIYIYIHIYSLCLVVCQKTILFHQHANECFCYQETKEEYIYIQYNFLYISTPIS